MVIGWLYGQDTLLFLGEDLQCLLSPVLAGFNHSKRQRQITLGAVTTPSLVTQAPFSKEKALATTLLTNTPISSFRFIHTNPQGKGTSSHLGSAGHVNQGTNMETAEALTKVGPDMQIS